MPVVLLPPSYHKDVVPILRSACLGCHAAPNAAAGFALASYTELMKGGKTGTAIVPGHSANSRLLQMMTGVVKPQMPPGGALKANDIDVIRRWIDAGAKDDAPIAMPVGKAVAGKVTPATNAIPRPKPLGRVRNTAAPVQALAFSPDGKTLAVGTYQRVLLCDPATRTVTTTWKGMSDTVRSVAFSPDGKWLAAGSGIGGAFGEIALWSVADNKPARNLGNQSDTVTSVAFSPDGKLLASGSIDKSIQLWDVATGKPLQTLRDHADGVLGLAFRNDGKYLVSCSTDKSVKVWDTATWRRLYSVGAHDEPVTAVVFGNGENPYITTSTDRTAKVWNLGADSSGQVRVLGGHSHQVLAVAITANGQLAATGAADKTVRLWNMADGGTLATFTDPTDWVYTVRFSPDGKRLAAGTWNGLVYFWNVETRKLEGTLSTLPTKP